MPLFLRGAFSLGAWFLEILLLPWLFLMKMAGWNERGKTLSQVTAAVGRGAGDGSPAFLVPGSFLAAAVLLFCFTIRDTQGNNRFFLLIFVLVCSVMAGLTGPSDVALALLPAGLCLIGLLVEDYRRHQGRPG
ncbi:hypothetical protein LOC54_08785 [Acetobacter sp. AN02]|uniref:hypothetical protein n=1 Tax=Acetobacter sp. AN02 TaxID=2894186 RepID=UPI0024345E74|nr:hypothetical protein [Acetobacter sp. AN02]MDG6095196.1 hypothetical protein [Acetobacter sp. AN02]